MREQIEKFGPPLLSILVIGTVLSILGPYDSRQLGMPGAWFYWTALMAIGWLGAVATNRLMDRWAVGLRTFPRYALLSLGASLPVFAGAVLIQAAIGPAYPAAVLPQILFYVWVVSAAVTTIGWLIQRRQSDSGAAEPAIGQALLEKLPHRLRRAEIFALEAEDHYLRVHTAAGDALILMRLSDAIVAVNALDGARTHRSWWVARSAVDAVSRGDGRARLTLRNGVVAPVSRTYAPGLREAGWY